DLSQRNECKWIDGFVWPTGVDPATYSKIRVSNDSDARDLDLIPVEELAAAAKWCVSQSYSLATRDLMRETLRIFGIKALTKRGEARMLLVIDELEKRGAIRVVDDRVE